MILIQALAAAWAVSAIRTTLTAQGLEINNLRDWRHKFGPKEMMVDAHDKVLADHEARLRVVERMQGQAETDEKQAVAIRTLWLEMARKNHGLAE